MFIGICLVPALSIAQDSSSVRQLSLHEAIDLSIHNSKQLRASQARIEEAEGALREAKDNQLPGASIGGTYMRLTTPTISLKTKILGGGSQDTTGGGSSPAINQAMYGSLNVSMPVFAGGKIRYGIQSAQYLEQATRLDADQDRQAVVLNTINAYVNLYKAHVTLDVVKANLQQSMQRDSVLSRLEQNGLLARNDLLKSRLQTSNIELSLLDAQNNLKIAAVNMDLMLGLPEQTELLTDSTAFDQPVAVQSVADYEQMALQNRKDLQALSFRQKAAVAGVSAAKGDLYPSIALTGGYIAADIPHFITITNAATLGVGVKYDIASLWKTKSKIIQAQARVKEIEANEALLDDNVRLAINRDYENYLLSTRKIQVYRDAVDQATENYRITKNKYDNNLVNTTDLLDANVALLQSQINLAVGKADVLLAYEKLLQSAGQIATN